MYRRRAMHARVRRSVHARVREHRALRRDVRSQLHRDVQQLANVLGHRRRFVTAAVRERRDVRLSRRCEQRSDLRIDERVQRHVQRNVPRSVRVRGQLQRHVPSDPAADELPRRARRLRDVHARELNRAIRFADESLRSDFHALRARHVRLLRPRAVSDRRSLFQLLSATRPCPRRIVEPSEERGDAHEHNTIRIRICRSRERRRDGLHDSSDRTFGRERRRSDHDRRGFTGRAR